MAIFAPTRHGKTFWRGPASAALAFGVLHGLLNIFLKKKKQNLDKPVEKETDRFSGVLQLLCTPESSEASNRLVSTTHAVVSLILGLFWILSELRPCGANLGANQRLAMQVSLGYFCYDLLFELVTIDAYAMIVHHLFAVVGLSYGLLRDVSGTDVLGAIFVAELSTPVLHLRFFLRPERATAEGQKWFDIVSIVFFIIFLSSRCLTLGPLITYFTVTSPTTPLFIKLCGLILYLVSLYWGAVLVRMAVKKF